MHDDLRFCRSMLPKVSRTFALAIRVLPPSLKPSVLVAYLLCRVADTIEDDTTLPKGGRVEALERLAEAVSRGAGDDSIGTSLRSLAAHSTDDLAPGSSSADGWLLAGSVHRVLNCHAELPESHRELIARCVGEMARGMARFVAGERARGVAAREPGAPVGCLEDEADLHRYADCVAGTVGRMLHEFFCRDIGIGDGPLRRELQERASPFGWGLQYTNIVQDLVADRRRGWVYVPRSLLARHGLTPSTLFERAHREHALSAVKDVIRLALPHLEKALEFTLRVPRSAPRIRLFCLWPLFLAVATLARAWENPAVLEDKVKIERRHVRRLLFSTSVRCLGERALRRLYLQESLPLQA